MKHSESESSVLEFKRTIPKDDQIVKTMIGFCNQHGGKLVIGVANNGTITGLGEQEVQASLEAIDKAIYDACSPPIIPRVYAQLIGEKTILIIEVSAGMNKPYFRKSEGLEKGTYIRMGHHTVRANADMIEELKWSAKRISYDCTPVYHADVDLLDHEAIQRFLEKRKVKGDAIINYHTLKSYYLIAEEHTKTYPSVAGLLLFNQDPQYYFPEAMIICTHFRGNEGRDVLATTDCIGTLFQQYADAMHFLTKRLYRSFKIKNAEREEELEIPEEALREVVINALVHRNYHIQGPTKIAIYDNRIEIFSPGVFPGPIDLDHLQTGATYIRNMAICKVFREAGYIEKLGSGLLTLFRTYKQKNLKTPQVIQGQNYIKCILPRETAAGPTQKSSDLEHILKIFDYGSEITVADVMERFDLPRSTASRHLSTLAKQGQIKRISSGRNTRYTKT